MPLFDRADLNKLEQLTLIADAVRVGAIKGNRRSHRRGASLEFSEYRDYTQGDDLRRLDWNVFARLERPFIKLTHDEEDLAVHILVDTSRSMVWHAAEESVDHVETKLRLAMQLAGALGYIGLLTGDFVHITLFDSHEARYWGPFRGRQNSWPLIQFLEASYSVLSLPSDTAGRQTSLASFLHDYAHRAQRPGLLFLLSDLLTLKPYREALSVLQERGYEIALLHILSEMEINPGWSGDLRMIDIETGESADVTLDPQMLEEYEARLTAWRSDIEAHCHVHQIHYTNIASDTPWEKVIFQSLARQRLVR